MNGFFLIDKEPGVTSFEVCKRLQAMLRVKKVGHTGTLDKFASGLLLLAVGRYTRLVHLLRKARKTYRAKILLGKTSDTLDPTVEIRDMGYSGPTPGIEQVKSVLSTSFQGRILQVPPRYSAIKLDGVRMSDRARAGQDFDVYPRETEIYNWNIIAYEYPELEVELDVMAGFYVRSFARDLGEKLVGAGMCLELRRIAIEDLRVESAVRVEQARSPVPPGLVLSHLPSKVLGPEETMRFRHGGRFHMDCDDVDALLLWHKDELLGVGEVSAGVLQPRVVL